MARVNRRRPSRPLLSTRCPYLAPITTNALIIIHDSPSRPSPVSSPVPAARHFLCPARRVIHPHACAALTTDGHEQRGFHAMPGLQPWRPHSLSERHSRRRRPIAEFVLGRCVPAPGMAMLRSSICKLSWNSLAFSVYSNTQHPRLGSYAHDDQRRTLLSAHGRTPALRVGQTHALSLRPAATAASCCQLRELGTVHFKPTALLRLRHSTTV